MPRPRRELVSVDDTPYYHVTSRCVRRAFLCGYDQETLTCYEHRRQWVEYRIRVLSSLFAIDVCAYAIMSNHYHIVLKLDPSQSIIWTDNDVIERWLSLFKGTLLVQKHRLGKPLTPAEQTTVTQTVATYRKRLTDLSWFMKCLNEPIARQANKEDQCTGHFWEARFGSQALRDEAALLACMVYVDLNPIRAKMAELPEHSDHTSIKERLVPAYDLKRAVKDQMRTGCLLKLDVTSKPLLAFSDQSTVPAQPVIPFEFKDYLKLIDWTGRSTRQDKCGAIPDRLSPILRRLQQSPQTWFTNATQFEANFRRQRFLRLRNE